MRCPQFPGIKKSCCPLFEIEFSRTFTSWSQIYTIHFTRIAFISFVVLISTMSLSSNFVGLRIIFCDRMTVFILIWIFPAIRHWLVHFSFAFFLLLGAMFFHKRLSNFVNYKVNPSRTSVSFGFSKNNSKLLKSVDETSGKLMKRVLKLLTVINRTSDEEKTRRQNVFFSAKSKSSWNPQKKKVRRIAFVLSTYKERLKLLTAREDSLNIEKSVALIGQRN